MEQTLGKRIAAHRKRLHLTQDQLAEKLGVTAQAVSKWENDQSCPDIAMLPKLAQLFDTTTDELLGQAPVYPGEVVAPEEENATDDRSSDSVVRKGSLGFALLLLLVGGLLLTSKLLDWDVGFWGIAWPSALLVFGIVGLIDRLRFTRIACALIGGYYLLDNLGVYMGTSGKLIFPALILLLGICLLVDALRKPRKQPAKQGPASRESVETFTQSEDGFDLAIHFGDSSQKVSVPCLTHGEAECTFGNLELDLTGCEQIADGCTVDIQCRFGGVTVIAPRSCRIQAAVSTTFGGVDTDGEPSADATATLRLTGDVAFGGIEIEYV